MNDVLQDILFFTSIKFIVNFSKNGNTPFRANNLMKYYVPYATDEPLQANILASIKYSEFR